METYLALDLGGTKLLIGEVDKTGKILSAKKYKSGYADQKVGTQGIFESLRDFLETTPLQGTIVAAGMGLTGMVDHKKGLWCSLSHLPGENVPLEKLLAQKLRVPAAIDNDVRSASTAELLLGCGKKTKDFIYLNVGTGLAAGFVIDGHIVRGVHNMSGEIGHTVLDLSNKTPCICGREGCCENVLSGIGFTAQANRLFGEYPDTKLPRPKQGQKVNGAEVFALAKQGDLLCERIVEEGIETLTCLILNSIRFSDPDTVVLGGGMISSGAIFEELKIRLSRYSIMDNLTGGVILSSFPTSDVGLIGASAVAMAIGKGI